MLFEYDVNDISVNDSRFSEMFLDHCLEKIPNQKPIESLWMW